MSIGDSISALFTSAGPGGAVVIAVIGLAAATYAWLLRWILKGGEEEQEKRYFR